MPSIASELLLADRIWLAVALLQREFPDREDFSKDEIRRKLEESGLGAGTQRGSVSAHLKEHLVANVAPSSGKYTMLFETRRGFLRLFRPGDFVHQERRTQRPSKHMPRREQIPQQYQPILEWYDEWSKQNSLAGQVDWMDDPLILLVGSGRHIWADEHADEYVNRLREEPA